MDIQKFISDKSGPNGALELANWYDGLRGQEASSSDFETTVQIFHFLTTVNRVKSVRLELPHCSSIGATSSQ